MKKLTVLCTCACLSLALSGCSLGDFISDYIADVSTETPVETEEAGQRVYMDEMAGQLLDFTGSQLTLQSDEEVTYIFDVSSATLECAGGMIAGDEISVIYEGQLSDTDTSAVKALKVVDEYHKKTELEDLSVRGRITSLTPNTITIRDGSGRTVTYPTTGAEQYYQSGLKGNGRVYIHFKGQLPESGDNADAAANAGQVKVLSVSDIDPLTVPEPTPTPDPAQDGAPAEDTKEFRAVIQDIDVNLLQLLPNGSETTLSLDLSEISCHFPGGIAPGSGVTVAYTGNDFQGESLDGISVTAVTGDDPERLDVSRMGFTATGVITGTTANTVTILTGDGASVTCFTENTQNASSGGLAPGSSVRITFDPSASAGSNIYTAIRIEDA